MSRRCNFTPNFSRVTKKPQLILVGACTLQILADDNRWRSQQITMFRNSGGGRGTKEACAPGGTLQGAAFGGSKVWNHEIWPQCLIGVCIVDSDILHPPNHINTLGILWLFLTFLL